MAEKKRTRTDANRRAEAKYRAASRKSIMVGFFPPDHDIYDFAKTRSGESAPAYIRRLIREDMERNG